MNQKFILIVWNQSNHFKTISRVSLQSVVYITFKIFQHVSPRLFPYLMPWVQISLNGSIWSVVSVAWERFTSIVYPSTK